LVKAKQAGRKVESVRAPQPANVINLMNACAAALPPKSPRPKSHRSTKRSAHMFTRSGRTDAPPQR
jgi:hypothetical protein